jgi:hypothetical protein
MIGTIRRIVVAGVAIMIVLAGGRMRFVMLGMCVGREGIRPEKNSKDEKGRQQRTPRER